jgi:hypothetical protein
VSKKVLFLFCVFLLQNLFAQTALERAFVLREQSYQTDLVVCADDQSEPFLISHSVTVSAQEQNRDLNESILFYTPFLKKTEQVRDFLYSEHHFGGKNITTDDKLKINYTYFDRDSDTLLVVGGGFLNQERVASFVKMFNECDVVIFNHVGIAYEESGIFKPSTWGYLIPSTFVFEGLNGKEVTFGKKEEEDVFAVVYDCEKNKTYKHVYGLALCYSAPIFVKAATVRPGLFDKLVLDGCWMDADNIIDAYVNTLGDEDRSWFYKLLPTSKDWCKKTFKWVGEKVSRIGLSGEKFDFTPHFKNLMIPTLFFHSANDLLVSNQDFLDLYSFVPQGQKVAILTKNGHMRNHIKQNELYEYITKSFFELPVIDFSDSLR